MKIVKGGLNIIVSMMLLGQIILPSVALASEPTVAPISTTPTPPALTLSENASQPPATIISSSSPSPTESTGVLPSGSTSPNVEPGVQSPSPSPSGSLNSTPQPASPAAPTALARGAEQVCHGNPPDWVFDNVAHKWVEADKDSFACDKPSGYYLSPKYYFDTRTGWYRVMPTSGEAPAGTLSSPQVIHTILGNVTVGSPEFKAAVAMGIITPTGQAVTASGTGSGSTNQGTINNSNQSWFDMTNLVNVINVLQSTAGSGTVAAGDNTKVGNVSTGAVSVVANLINLLASAWSWSHGNLNFFMQNLFGNQTGDIHLQPGNSTAAGGGLGSQLVSNAQTGANSTNAGTINNNDSLNVNAKSTGNITNNVSLGAGSGNANVADNTRAGNVKTGDATAQVNIINMINSFINSGSSFFGILNIFGNLNGDVLFPDGFLNGLLGTGPAAGGSRVATAGTGANSINQAGINNNRQSNQTGNSTQNFNNNVSTAAQSGNANIAGNTTTGSVGTGDSKTTNSLFNISNSSIFGDNAVLVMVNVLGHWMGRIMSLPGGSSEAALLTGNATVTQNNTGSGSTNNGEVNNLATANIKQASAGTITNNIDVTAGSGNANVTDNTKVGDIATGSAKAASSVANLMNTALNVKHWFGVLIINVFGEWTGSVNENTSAGNTPSISNTAPASGSGLVSFLIPASERNFTQVLVRPKSFAGSVATSPDATMTDSGATGQVLTAAAHIPDNVVTLARGNQDLTWAFVLSFVLLLLAGATTQIERKLRNR